MRSLRLRFEPLISSVFRAYWRVQRGMTLGVRGVAVDDQGRVLLVRHTYVAGWHLPGGGVEKDELAEEGGVEATGPLELVAVYSNAPIFRNDHVLLYRVPAWRPCAIVSAGEIAERGFFPPDAPPEGSTRGTRARLAELFAGAPVSTHWTPR
jgi:ADP-ribose pyrophosphatase YjhB (NUDIX family)